EHARQRGQRPAAFRIGRFAKVVAQQRQLAVARRRKRQPVQQIGERAHSIRLPHLYHGQEESMTLSLTHQKPCHRLMTSCGLGDPATRCNRQSLSLLSIAVFSPNVWQGCGSAGRPFFFWRGGFRMPKVNDAGYLWHRPGSIKGRIHKEFDESGLAAALALGEKIRRQTGSETPKESTIRSWAS